MIPCKELAGKTIIPVYPWCPIIIPFGVCRASRYRAPWWVGSMGIEHITNNMETQNPNAQVSKRHREEVSPGSSASTNKERRISDADCIETEVDAARSWARFLVIESQDNTRQLSSLSPFIVEKALKGMIGSCKTVKQLRSGSLLVETSRPAQSQNLLRQTVFANIPIKVSEHKSLNTSKGVIRSFELSRMEPDDLVSELSSQGVIEARCIKQKRGDVIRPTPVVILTFAQPEPPKEIKAGYLVIKVDVFVPNPLRCFKCQKFGHHQSTCSKPSICARCSQPAHDDEPCKDPVKCPNCSGEHPAFFNTCPNWLQEKEVCRIKVTQGISFPEARKRVVQMTPGNAGKSYSTVVKATTMTFTRATQTDCHCHCTCPPVSIPVEPGQPSSSTQTLQRSTDEDEGQSNCKNTIVIREVGQVTSDPKRSQSSSHNSDRMARRSSHSPRGPGAQSGSRSKSPILADAGASGTRTTVGRGGRNASWTKIKPP
jgi:hypothetical protein